MQKRIAGIFCAVILMMTALIHRVYYIGASDYLTMASAGQGSYSLTVASTRGVIYDRNMRPLVNNTFEYIASVLPSPQAAAALVPAFPEEERTAVVEKLAQGMPFAVKLPTNAVYARGIDIFRVPKRYGGYQYAPHVIGYMGGDGEGGVAGMELAFDGELKKAGGLLKCLYGVDAAGHVMSGAAMSVQRDNEVPAGGVSLTLDADVQRAAQEALLAGCEKGGVVVMDVSTGDILAMASIPAFDQNDIAASLSSDDAPFISRAVSGYNIGSVFKLMVASAALEKGISVNFEHVCEGYEDVGGVVFHCNNNAVHGACDMQRALNVSCNTYFIALARQLGGEYLLSFSENMGFGRSAPLDGGITPQTGNLPDLRELESPAALANLGFGQGSSLATPLQMAAAVSTIANGGYSVTPRLVRGVTYDGAVVLDEREPFAESRLISEKNSSTMRRLMTGVVNEGSGKPAKPASGGAGGKTSSAQTGQYIDGVEIVHAWFVGFYPAESPEYAISVFVEGGTSGERVAAPIFKRVADALSQMDF